MPKLNMVLPHRLTKEESLRRSKTLLSEVFADTISDLEEAWDGDSCSFSFRAKGFSVSGTMRVNNENVKIDGSLPFAAVFFKGQIESTIRERADQLLT